MDVMVVGIAGGTGSGKTTLTERLKERFGGDVSVIYHDNYYKRHDELPYEERCKLNYDHLQGGRNLVALDMIVQRVHHHIYGVNAK